MMLKVKATKTSAIQSLLQDFSEEFMKVPTQAILQFMQLYGFLQQTLSLKVIKIRPNTKTR